MLNEATAIAAHQKERVLLVDDEPQVLVALEDLLSEDFVVFATDEPERALRIVENEPDLAVVVSDERMPRMTGSELLTRLRKRSTASRILATGYADLNAVVKAVNDGQIFAYVTKPWNQTDFRQMVQHAAEHFRLGQRLAEERQLLQDLMTSLPDAIFFKDKQQRFLRVNEGMVHLAGVQVAEQLIGRRLTEVLPGSSAASVMEEAEATVFQTGKDSRDFGHRHPRVVGKSLATTVSAVHNVFGEVVGLVGISRDVTERVRAEQALRVSEERFRQAFAASNAKLFEWNIDGGDVALWGASDGARGPHSDEGVYPVEALAELVHPDDLGRLRAALKAHLERREPFGACEIRAMQGDRYRWLELNAQATWSDDGKPVRLIGSSTDITTRKEHAAQQARLEFLASFDELTGLPNRNVFLRRLERHLSDQAEVSPSSGVAVVVIDIGRLRRLNETLGRESGDELLKEVAGRLTAAMRPGDTLARHEGGSFAIVIGNVKDATDVTAWLEERAFPLLGELYVIRGAELRIAVRAGIGVAPADGRTPAQLLANADAALAKAKHGGRAYLFYAPEMNSRVAEKLTLELRLRRALAEEEFLLFYQPKVQLKTGKVVGVEALIRWRDPERGMISPGDFIPLLEETGMILDAGAWVLAEAARQYAAWKSKGLNPPRIAVNVSALQLADPGFVDSLDTVLAWVPEAKGGLDLEITESVFVDDLAGNIEKLRSARDRGFRIAIDDFGTGYSSLGYLSRMPLDALKIDRSFVGSMADDPQQMSIVTTIISLAHALELHVIAEGVETLVQAHLLRLQRCDEAQGYLLSRPVPGADVEALFAKTFDLTGGFTK